MNFLKNINFWKVFEAYLEVRVIFVENEIFMQHLSQSEYYWILISFNVESQN